MARTHTSRFYNFYGKDGLNGGLNVSDDVLIIAPQDMAEAENVLIGQTLSRKKRPGLVNYHTSSYASTASWPTSGSAIRGLIQYWRYASATGAPTEDIFLHSEDKVWQVENRLLPAVNRTGALTLSSTSIPSYQVFEGILYFCSSDTADGYCKWDGLVTTPSDATSAVAPPDGAGKYLGIFNGRMVMAGNPDFPFRVYLSTTLDAENWTGLDATSFDLSYDGDPDGVTAIFPELEGRLFIATRRAIYELTGTTISNFSVRRVTRGVGCCAHQSVVATGNDILFASDRGIHSLKKVIVSDQSTITFLSQPIQTLWSDLLNAQRLQYAQAAWDENLNIYIVSVPSSGSTENDVTLCYNLTYGHWTQWEDIDARSLGNVRINQKQYIMTGREDGKLSFLDPSVLSDFGTGYQFLMKSGKFFPDSLMTNQFRFLSVTILAAVRQPSTVSISWSIDTLDGVRTGTRSVQLGSDSALLGTTFILGSSRLGIGRFLPQRVSVGDVGYNFQLEIASTGTSDINFLGWVLEVEDADPVYT
jgi:hypothetical protein